MRRGQTSWRWSLALPQPHLKPLWVRPAAAVDVSSSGRWANACVIAVDERLSEVAGALGKAGIATEWGANALLVFGGRVVVRKGAAGSNDLLLNGTCSSEFYRVQSVLYQQTHVS